MSVRDRYDVIIAGFGFAGGAAAIAAADAGANVLLLEKMLDPGGISITAGGGLRVSQSADLAFEYIKASNAGRTPDENIRPIADGMVWISDWFGSLAAEGGASTAINPRTGNYPFVGYDQLAMLEVKHIPYFDPRAEYPHARALTGGTRMEQGGAPANVTGGGAGVFKVVELAVQARCDRIDVRLGAPVERLLVQDGAVCGVRANIDGRSQEIAATRGVILACGGFESAPDMQEQFWQITPVLSSACRGNTGDGIRMAVAMGADLWHMWHYHGTYGFRHPDHAGIGIRMKRLPDWRPEGFGQPSDAEERAAIMSWILVDQNGKRFMNEYGPYVQDTGHRDMEPYDPGTLRFPRVPCWCVFDEAGRERYPVGSPVLNDRDPSVHYDWSADNQKEVQNGLLRRAESVEQLAALMQVDPEVLTQTIDHWNQAVAAGRDSLGRPGRSMATIMQAPFYCGQIWPVVSNTQGGPRHDPQQRVVTPYNDPIDGLYVAGELGSIWGSLYTAGCNLTECFVTGKIAAEHAAARVVRERS